jgi:hypothetical protein
MWHPLFSPARGSMFTAVRAPDLREGMFLLYSGREMRSRGEDNIKMDIRKIGCEGVHQFHLAQGCVQCQALVNTVMNSP